MNLASLSCGSDGNQNGKEDPEHEDGDGHDVEEDKESLKKANKEKEEKEVVTVTLGWCAPAAESLPLSIIKEMEDMFLRLGFSPTVAQKLVDDQRICFPWTLARLSDEIITVICDVFRR